MHFVYDNVSFMIIESVGSKYDTVGDSGRNWGWYVISPVLLSCLAHTHNRLALSSREHHCRMMSHSLTPIYTLTEWYVIHKRGLGHRSSMDQWTY